LKTLIYVFIINFCKFQPMPQKQFLITKLVSFKYRDFCVHQSYWDISLQQTTTASPIILSSHLMLLHKHCRRYIINKWHMNK
jgi:hypothetical protein